MLSDTPFYFYLFRNVSVVIFLTLYKMIVLILLPLKKRSIFLSQTMVL